MEPHHKEGKARIRDWKGLLAVEDRATKLRVFAALLLVSSSMAFVQFGFIGVGVPGDYAGYVLALLGPIALTALLLGRLYGFAMGLLCGAILYAHALVMPLDLYESYFVTPLNSFALYASSGLLSGLLFSVALRNDPQGKRRVAYMAIVSVLVACFASAAFLLNTYIDFSYAVYTAQDLDAVLSQDTLLAISGMGDSFIQAAGDFVIMFALCLLADKAVTRIVEARAYESMLPVFRVRLLIGALIVFLLVQTFSFVAITISSLASAQEKMESELTFIGAQLAEKSKYLDTLITMPEFNDLSEDSFLNLFEATSSEQLINGYDVDTDGIVAVFFDEWVAYSNCDAYPTEETADVVFGKGGFEMLGEVAESGEMYRVVYNKYPQDVLAQGDDEVLGSIELGFMYAKQVDEYNIGMMMMPSSMVFAERSATMAWASLLGFLLMVAVYVLAARLLRVMMLEPIVRVNESLSAITNGDLDETVSEVGCVEFAMLSSGINTTVNALKDFIDEAERRNERDLATAKKIQESALPRTFPPFPEIDAFDLYASMNAAKEVGGDFYDFFLIDDHTLGFLIADVSGKGIPGALFMMAAKTEIENYLSTGMEPAEAIASANQRLCKGNEAGMFVTVWAATLDWRTGLLTYVNAGHNFPLLRHGFGGSWEWLTKKCGLFLGTFETAKYRQETLTLEPGDELLLYTDGVNEAFNIDEKEYGNDRLEAFLMAHNRLRAEEIVLALRADVAKWAGEAEQSDDVTMLALEFGTSSEAAGSMTVKADLDNIGSITRMVSDELERRLCPLSVRHKIDIALEELFVNVCNYAYEHLEESGDVTVSYTYTTNPSTIRVELRDSGMPFDPIRREDPTKPSGIHDVRIGGLGIYMVKRTMDDFTYERDGDCNVVAFTKSW